MSVICNANRALCLSLPDLEQPVSYEQLFGRVAPVELEVGAGRGDFLIEYARENPDRDFIGVERTLAVLRRAIRKLERAELPNATFINAEIAHLLRHYFPERSLFAVHLYFPDPWPKTRHVKRRVFQDDTPALFERVLQPGGSLHLRTDVQWYFEDMLRILARYPQYQRIEIPVEILKHQTAFEKRFMSSGKPLFRESFVLKA